MNREFNNINSLSSKGTKKFLTFTFLVVFLSTLLFVIPERAARPAYYTVYDKKEKMAYMLPPDDFYRWKAEGEPPIREFVEPRLRQESARRRSGPRTPQPDFPPV